MSDLGILGLEFEHNFAIIENRTLENVKFQNFLEEKKCLNLEPKIRYLSVLGSHFEKFVYLQYVVKCFVWVFLGWNFEQLLLYLKLATLDLSKASLYCEFRYRVRFF